MTRRCVCDGHGHPSPLLSRPAVVIQGLNKWLTSYHQKKTKHRKPKKTGILITWQIFLLKKNGGFIQTPDIEVENTAWLIEDNWLADLYFRPSEDCTEMAGGH